jgi:hypothetical protein
MSPYKNIRKQRKYSRLWSRAKRAGKQFENPWKGMEKITTERVKRKGRMLPVAVRNGRKPGTWLKAPPKRGSNPRKQR